ncbi:MAG TPA: ABC transporter permease [Saprospiraceae bacterium]|nr:ABC transporter permease [Saprospiraceae bacterium]
MISWDNIIQSLSAIKDNLLRSVLTILIIAVGIACLVGILTAIDTLLFSLSSNFSRLGTNAFNILPKREEIRVVRGGRQFRDANPISFREALTFKDRYEFRGSIVGVEYNCTSNAVVKAGGKETSPSVRISGIDEHFIDIQSLEIELGRNFTTSELESGASYAIIGRDIVNHLFDGNVTKAIGESIILPKGKYRVIGVLKGKGSSGGISNDLRVHIPLLNAKNYYGTATRSYVVSVGLTQGDFMEEAMSEAIGVMRVVRGLKPSEENDFMIRKSDSLLNTLRDLTSTLRLATVIIALLTLFGAAIGLMNIMLVSVTERTREIGIRKAVGANKQTVLFQFLTEAVVICLVGGLVGILAGLGMGYLVSVLIDGVFYTPWKWMALGIVVCAIVGIISGLYPAFKAANLDPIESLRYE